MATTPTRPGAKLPKDDPRVLYMEPDAGPFKCGNCQHFSAPVGCAIVDGSIAFEGCCNYYAPGAKREAAAKRAVAEIVKVDQMQGIVYGWGNVCVENGELVTDRQGDIWEPHELEKSVIDFMLNCRDSGVMHAGEVVGTVVASLVTTPDIVKAFFGDAAAELVPIGWLIGVKVEKPLLQKVLDGEYRAFSIQGSGSRIPVDA